MTKPKHTPSEAEKAAVLDAVFTPLQSEEAVAMREAFEIVAMIEQCAVNDDPVLIYRLRNGWTVQNYPKFLSRRCTAPTLHAALKSAVEAMKEAK